MSASIPAVPRAVLSVSAGCRSQRTVLQLVVQSFWNEISWTCLIRVQTPRQKKGLKNHRGKLRFHETNKETNVLLKEALEE